MTQLETATARRVVNHLKAGTTPIDCVDLLNVGNDRWYKEAVTQLEDVAGDGDALVRFVCGSYGAGKTHFLGMLQSLALKNRWMVSYVTAENTPFHKMEVVYAEMVKGITLPADLPMVTWLTRETPQGSMALLCAFFSKLYLEVYGALDVRGTNRVAVIHDVNQRVAKYCASAGIHDLVSKALIAFVESALKQDSKTMIDLAGWFQGDDVKLKDFEITKRIDQRLARDVMRGISEIARFTGLNGTLMLFDEAEMILQQSKSVRTKAYAVIRVLLDNADRRAGMKASVLYIASTPDMFSSAKGFSEYEALRERLVHTLPKGNGGLIDYRSVVVDLTRTPLPHDLLVHLAGRVRDVHATGRKWDAAEHVPDELLRKIVHRIEKSPYTISKPRMVVTVVANFLDRIEQHRESVPLEQLDKLIKQVAEEILTKPAAAQWEAGA